VPFSPLKLSNPVSPSPTDGVVVAAEVVGGKRLDMGMGLVNA